MLSDQNLHRFIGQRVKINRGGPESEEGRLLDVQHDYISLLPDKGNAIYFNSRHIKSYSKLDKPANKRKHHSNVGTPPYFHQLLFMLQGKEVQVNRGGPEKIAGFLRSVYHDNLVLTTGKESIQMPIYHIKSISILDKREEKESRNRKSSNQKSGNRKSSSQKSSNQKSNKRGTSNHRKNGKR